MKILVLSIIFPYPSTQGSSLRMAATLEALAQNHEIYLLGFSKTDIPPTFMEHAKKFCKEIHCVRVRSVERLRNALLALPTPRPISLGLWRNLEMRKKILHICSRIPFDAAFLFDIKMTSYLYLLSGEIKRYVDLDISYARYYRALKSYTRGPKQFLYSLEEKRMEKYEKMIIATTDGCYIASEVDKNVFPATARDNIRILPNVVDIGSLPFQPAREDRPHKIILTGKFSYTPNVDGARFFRNEIFPHIKRKIPDVSFWIVGANPSKSVRKLHDGKGVFVTGFVEDIKAHLYEAGVFVCPLRFGGGTRLKILEAMALGIPVVSTSAGCEGLNVENGGHLFIEDVPEAFAQRVIEIISNTIDVSDMCQNARRFVELNYDRKSLVIEGLTTACEE